MATRYYLTGSNSYTTCDVSPSYDMSLIDAAGILTNGTSSTSYVEIMTFDFDAAGIASTGTYDVSVPINGLGGTSNNRWRLQQIDSGTCAVLNSSSYSAVYTTTGLKTDSLSLTWTGTTGILRLSLEQQKTGGAGPRTIDILIDTTSYVDVPAYTAPPPASELITIVRDLWWSHPSGDNYLLNENGALSSYSVGLYQSLGSGDSRFINIRSDAAVASGTVNTPYYFRVSHNNIVPNSIYVPIRYSAGTFSSGNPLNLSLTINGVHIGDVGSTTSTSGVNSATTLSLSDTQRKAILDNRQDEVYDNFKLLADAPPTVLHNSKIYDLEIRYPTSNTTAYSNFQAASGTSVNLFYPVGIGAFNTSWKNNSGAVLSSGDLSLISASGSDSGADTSYIQCWNEPPQTTPQSGHLTLNFDVGNTYNYNANINKANLHLRLSLPNSGIGNQRDVFQVIGHSPNLGSGNIIWGSGGVVETSGFRLFDTELSWTNPWNRDIVALSGNRSSAYFRSAESLRNLSLRLIGLPSGTQLSAASLRVESQPSNSLSLRTIGGDIIKRNITRSPSGTLSNEVDYNRYRGYAFIDNSGTKEIFDKGYYQFREIAGPICFSQSNASASGVYVTTSTLASGNPTRTHYYKDRAITQHNSWRNGIFVSNSTSSRSNHIDFGNRLHASGIHSFFIHATSKSSRFSLDNADGNILLYRGNGTNHEYILNLVGEELHYNLFDQVGNINETLTIDLGTANNALIIGTYIPSSGAGSNGVAALYTYEFGGTNSSAFASGFNSIQYNDSYTSLGGSRNLAASIVDMDTNYDGWINEFGIAGREFGVAEVVNFAATRTTGFNYSTQPENLAAVNSSNNNKFYDFEFNPASGNISENIRIPILGNAEPIRNNVPGFYELDYPHYANYGHIPVNPSAIQLEMVITHNTNHPSGAYLTGIYSPIDGSLYETYGGQVLLPSSTMATVKTTLFTKHTKPMGYANDDYDYTNLLIAFKHDNPNFYSEMKIHSVNLKMDAWMESAAVSGSPVYLAISGANFNNSANLYLQNNFVVASGNLYIKGHTSTSGTQNLMTLGSPASIASTTLYTAGQAVFSSGSQNLYIVGAEIETNIMNLYTVSTAPPQTSGTLPLIIHSTTNPSTFTTTDLYINSELDPLNVLNLVTRGTGGSLTSTFNLSMNAEPEEEEVNEDVPNTGIIINTPFRKLMMMIRGTGTAYSGAMNLYMARGGEGTTNVTPLYVKTVDSYAMSGDANLYTKSIYSTPSVFYAVGDSYVSASSTSTNYGTLGILRVNS